MEGEEANPRQHPQAAQCCSENGARVEERGEWSYPVGQNHPGGAMAKNSNNSKLRQAALEAVRIQVAHRGQKEARLLNLLSGGSSTAQPTSGANKHLRS